MGAGVSRRYKYGIRPNRYFERHVLPNVQPLLTSLEIPPLQAFELFQAFIKIDVDCSGDIGLREYQRFLGIRKTTAFTERVFGCSFDGGVKKEEGGGGGDDDENNLSYEDFLKGVWRFCTYDAILMSMFFFNIFDVDHQGKLEIEECDALLRMAHDKKTADPTLLALIERRCRDDNDNGDEHNNDDDDDDDDHLMITAESFAALVDDEPRILQPAFDLRDKMREGLLGLDYWDYATKRRLERFGIVDSLDEIIRLSDVASDNEHCAMIASSSDDDDDDDKEEEEEEDADLSLQKTQSARLTSISNDEKIRSSEEENGDNIDVVVPSSETKRKKRTEIDDKNKKNIMELTEERRERKLRKKLTTTHHQLQSEQHYYYTMDNVHERTRLRKKLWKLFDETKSSSNDALIAQKRKELDELELSFRSKTQQRKEKLTSYLETEEGRRRLARDVADVRARLIVEAWAGGNIVQRFFNRLIIRKGRRRRRRRRRRDDDGDDSDDYEYDDEDEEEEDEEEEEEGNEDDEEMKKKEDEENDNPRPVLSSWAVPLVSRLNSRVNDQAREECVKAIEQSFLQDEINAIEDAYRKRTSSLFTSWKKYHDDLVKTFGPPHTHWEKLVRIIDRGHRDKQQGEGYYDDNNNDDAGGETRYFWYNTTTAEKIEHQRDPAICESCDAFIDCVDYKCFSCGELRSEINKERYKGRIPLNDIEEIRRQRQIRLG